MKEGGFMEEEWTKFLQRGPGQFADLLSCYRRTFSGKTKKKTLKEIVQNVSESLLAMGNAEGGTVLLGATAGGEVEGIFFDDRSRRLLQSVLEKSFMVPLIFNILTEEIEGKEVLCFTIPPSPRLHVLSNGKCYLRVGPENILFSKEKKALLGKAREETWHERTVLLKSSLSDLEQSLLSDFIGHLRVSGDVEQVLHRPYGLIEYHSGEPVLTRAAAYLFAKDPLRWHPWLGMEFVRFEGSERGTGSEYNIVERVRLEGPILKLTGGLDDFLRRYVREKIVPRDLFFQEKFEYPLSALREALINAFAHRDYRLEGGAVAIWMFDDRIEIHSPGSLPGPVTLPQILRGKRAHYSRNPLMSRVLVDCGYMTATGGGLPRIFHEMEKHGLNHPELKADEGCYSLIFYHTPFMDKKTLEWLEQFSRHSLNPRQKRILVYAQAHGLIFSSTDYQKLGVDRDTAYTEIKEMTHLGIVQPLKKHGKVYRVRQ
jgi:ATP-dependent DNA helicase RecG